MRSTILPADQEDYLELSLELAKKEFIHVQAVLERMGALSVTTLDAQNHPVLEPLPGQTPLWPHLTIQALFPANKNKQKVERALKTALAANSPPLVWRHIPEQDWERAWLPHYEPIKMGDALWIGPQSFTPPATTRAVLFLDPGLAFGTGSHPTTFLCLEWLSQQNLSSKTLLDFGCGSGILGLSALKLGLKHATLVDIDPQALVASRENAHRNALPDEAFSLFLPEDCPQTLKAHILMANILATPLIALRETLLSYLRPRGSIVLSGILKEQAHDVASAYLKEVEWDEPTFREGWVRLSGKMRKNKD